MKVFNAFVIFFILSLPFARWYVAKYQKVIGFEQNYNLLLRVIFVFALFTMFLYLFTAGYREHIETSVAMLALMVQDGQAIYASFEDSARNQLVYGPTTYIFQGWFMQFFGDQVFASKLYGIVCTLLGGAILYFLIARKMSPDLARKSLLFFSMFVLMYGQVTFRNQSESIIILGNALAASSALFPSSWLSMLMLATGSALSINAKFHSAGYILPLLIIFYRQHGMKRLYVIAGITIALIILPFTMSQFSIVNFVSIIREYSSHKYIPYIFIQIVTMGLVIAFPVIYHLYLSITKSDNPLESNDAFKTSVLSFLMLVAVAAIASKEGAGLHHLIPFMPSIIVLYSIYKFKNRGLEKEFLGKQSKKTKIILTSLFISWFLSLTAYAYSTQKYFYFYFRDNQYDQIQTELVKIRDDLADKNMKLVMGFSDTYDGYHYTFVRPLIWPVSKNNLFDPGAMMDIQFAGIETVPKETLERFARQEFDIVIIPNHGEPFSMNTWYPLNKSLFGEQLAVVFKKNYQPYREYTYFVLWKANKLLETEVK